MWKFIFAISFQAIFINEGSLGTNLIDKAYILPAGQPVAYLNASNAFAKLSSKEQLYAHHLSRASFFGGLIVQIQVSLESPQIFRLLYNLFHSQPPADLKEVVMKQPNIEEKDFGAFLIYTSGIFSYMGNYKSYGETKFVPDLTPEKFEIILKASKAWNEKPELMAKIWNSVRDAIWSLSDKGKQLGLGEKGVTKYFSSNCNQSDAEVVSTFLKKNSLEAWMTRVFKTINSDGKTIYEIRSAAVEETQGPLQEFDGSFFKLTTGDFSPLLKLVNVELSKAKDFSASDLEKSMLENYIESFTKGNLDSHKNGSRLWIKNKNPIVETYIGFIETYRDPDGQRGEFEGFVSVVNKDQSIKFQKLVSESEQLLPLLPWPRYFEKDTFLRPDFTSLDVLTFAGSAVYKGINIPNYGDIRQTEGFKNVYLNNVAVPIAGNNSKPNFLSEEDGQLLRLHIGKILDIQVGLHELLGHGSGKILTVDANGKFNFNETSAMNPLTGTLIDPKSVYKVGETYESKFESLSSSFEECRAESVGLVLSVEDAVLNIFNVSKEIREDVVYGNWLFLCLTGITGLEYYVPSTKEWKQAHSRGRFAILNVLIEAGQDFIKVKQIVGDDGKPDLQFKMDKSKLKSIGLPAVRNFLLKLQTYKSLGDISSAKKMFDTYTTVSDDTKNTPWLTWRNIVEERKVPRIVWIQANTVVKDGIASLISYEESYVGLIQSWIDRFPGDEFKAIDDALAFLYEKEIPFFKE